MLKALASAFLFSSLFTISISVPDNDLRCNCDVEGFWSIDNILECQRVGDLLIAVAYFSIPIELLYFVSCSNFPFKWVLFQFIAFIVLCGMTHLLSYWTYGPHSFQLMLSVTVFKLLTALVSFATAITLITLIPLLLKVKVREFMLRKKTWDLDREVGIIRKQREAGLHVRMLTQEIRKSLDRHTILYTTLVELSKTLDLDNCAIWMLNSDKTEMNLTHELKERNFPNAPHPTIPKSHPDVREIKGSDGVTILNSDSSLAVASCGGGIGEPGSVAAIRMPMLRVSNFKGGTPEMVPQCYAILVLVLSGSSGRSWTDQELEIVEVVADQVAVALSHASVLEESQLMREKLEEQNRALQQAKQDALMASRARVQFQTVMSGGLRRPMHSIIGLLSMLREEATLGNEQRLLVDAMVKTGDVVSALVSDVMDSSGKNSGRFRLDVGSFRLHSTVKEAACVSKCLCGYRGFDFEIEVDKSLPNHVMGDERRVFQVILHMVGNLLGGGREGGFVVLRIFSVSGSQQRWGGQWGSNSSDGYAYIRVEVGICYSTGSRAEDTMHPLIPYGRQRYSGGVEESMSFSACKNLVQLMQGDIWMVSNPQGFDRSMALVLRFQIRPSIVAGISSDSSDHVQYSNSLFRGLRVLLADSDDVNRAVTRKLLEKLGCLASSVSSGYDCLNAIGPAVTLTWRIVILDLNLPDLDGFEVTARIRKFRSRSWPLIVGLTTIDDGDVMERCHEMGMNGVIQKPGSILEIAYELRRVLTQASSLLS